MGTTWDGFFKAPATGQYRFYISCRGNCKLDMDTQTPLESLASDQVFVTEVVAHRNQNHS